MVARTSAGIYEYELLAELLGATIACEVAPVNPIVLCCDNRGAVGTVIRGKCKTVLGRTITSTLWATASRFARAIWVDPAKSACNPSDPPSRMCLRLAVGKRHERATAWGNSAHLPENTRIHACVRSCAI